MINWHVYFKEGQSKQGVIWVPRNMYDIQIIYLNSSKCLITPYDHLCFWQPPAIQHTLPAGPWTTPSNRILSWILLYAAVYALFEPLIATRIFGNWNKKGLTWHVEIIWEMVEDVEVLWLVVFGDMGVLFPKFSQKTESRSSFNPKPHHIQPITVFLWKLFRLNFWHQIGTTEQRSYWL